MRTRLFLLSGVMSAAVGQCAVGAVFEPGDNFIDHLGDTIQINPTVLPALAGAVVASHDAPFSLAMGAEQSGYAGVLHSWVVRETASGQLDFYFRVEMTLGAPNPGYSPLMWTSLVAGGYAGQFTDLYARNDFTGTEPWVFFRSFDGDMITFGTSPGGIGENIQPGGWSLPMLIRTHATEFVSRDAVTLAFIGNATEEGEASPIYFPSTPYLSSFAPIVPEPTSLVLLGLGLPMLLRRRWRRY